jgi:hypothetical protein
MKMRRYSFEVKLFALDKRRQGRGWGEIRRAIAEMFKIEPPTVRAMQRWEKDVDRDVLNRALKEKAKKEAEVVKGQTLTMVAEGLLPQLWKARDAGEDIEYAGWNWFFRIVESSLGTEKFRRFINNYLREREGQPDLPPMTPTWTAESRKEVEQNEG